MHVANDGCVYKDQIKELFLNPEDQEDSNVKGMRGVLILIPLRLGLDKLNPVYHPALKVCLSYFNTSQSCFHQSHCVGIAGFVPLFERASLN